MPVRIDPLASDLRRIFGSRLRSLVAYGAIDGDPDGLHTLALLETLTFRDLAACVPLVPSWQRSGFAVPLLLTHDEFLRSLDVFPVEYGDIIARHTVIAGGDPFAGMTISEADLRRSCEHQAKSHLIHLREGFLEYGAQPTAIARMIAASAPALHALVANLERLDSGAAGRAGLTPELLSEIAAAEGNTIVDPSALVGRYLAAVERLWQHVDQWRGHASDRGSAAR